MAMGTRETGWAVLDGSGVAASGVAGLKSRRKVVLPERIAYQLDALRSVVSRWRPACAVRSRAGAINWPTPGLEQLDAALHIWANELGLPLSGCTVEEVRAAIAGRRNASRDAQCYAIMRRLGLIGQSRATAEWEAIAVGYYHWALREDKGGMSAKSFS